MDQVEASGKTVEDALKQALAKLRATEDEVEFVVLDEGRKGLFGRGARDAIVRVERRVPAGDKPTAVPAVPQQQPRRGGERAPGRRPPPPRDRDRGRQPLDRMASELTAADFAPREGAGRKPGPAAQPPRQRARPSPRPEAGTDERASSAPPPRRSVPAGEEADQPYVAPDIEAEEVDYAAQLVDDILRILDIDAEITIREPMTDGDGRGSALAVVDLEGEDLGLLIGRRGETLQALQYFVNVALAHKFPNRGTVTVDAEHYRHRREEQLVSLARRMAERVSRTGDSITLEPMSPAERRLIHMALAEDPEVQTNSTGSGDSRKVVISPRD